MLFRSELQHRVGIEPRPPGRKSRLITTTPLRLELNQRDEEIPTGFKLERFYFILITVIQNNKPDIAFG